MGLFDTVSPGAFFSLLCFASFVAFGLLWAMVHIAVKADEYWRQRKDEDDAD